MRTAQQLFDIVATHLLKQGAKSVRAMDLGNYRCAYRGANGMKCAVGALIPDECYKASMEDFGITAVVGEFSKDLGHETLAEEFSANNALLCFLQGIRDSARVAEWPDQLARLAAEHDLIMPVVEAKP